MFNLMFALHLLFAIFAVGPLAHAAMTASRSLRQGDVAVLHTSARMTRFYTYGSVLAIVFGFGLMSSTSPYTNTTVARFGETWIWLSLVLWLLVVVLALSVIAPSLDKAAQGSSGSGSGQALMGRVTAAGWVSALILAVIVFLMVYQPGG